MSEPSQDPLFEGFEPPPLSSPKERKSGYLNQLRIANPPLCPQCVQANMDGTRLEFPAHSIGRVTHRAWLPGMEAPILLCAACALAFSEEHGISRASKGAATKKAREV